MNSAWSSVASSSPRRLGSTMVRTSTSSNVVQDSRRNWGASIVGFLARRRFKTPAAGWATGPRRRRKAVRAVIVAPRPPEIKGTDAHALLVATQDHRPGVDLHAE